jgi:hypothetical protein
MNIPAEEKEKEEEKEADKLGHCFGWLDYAVQHTVAQNNSILLGIVYVLYHVLLPTASVFLNVRKCKLLVNAQK